MKISIKNFGPIDHFEFDLEKDLHVIYGENNIGKSWAISLVYLILKPLNQKTILNKKKNDFLKEIDEEGNQSLLEKMEYNRLPDTSFFDILLDNLNKSLNNTFGETKNLISGKEPEIKIITENFELVIEKRITERNQFSSIFYRKELNPIKRNESVKTKTTLKYDSVFFIPASKSGIYQVLSNMGNIFAQLSQYRSQLKDSSLQLPSMSEPISDYILNLSSIQTSKQDNFKDLVKFLEENVIEGDVTFDEFQKKLKYKSKKTGLNLELSEASSMIAEISPLIAYLKYIVPKSNAILFIEEPEAHLHPKVQVEMMKVFVDLVKVGVKVVMTTHSDFMMNQLSNSLLEKTILAEQVASYHLKMGEKGSFDIGDMKATNEGIQDYNFTETAIELYENRMDIIEKLNQNAIREN